MTRPQLVAGGGGTLAGQQRIDQDPNNWFVGPSRQIFVLPNSPLPWRPRGGPLAKKIEDRDRRVWRRCPFYSPVQVVHARGVVVPAPLAADISASGIRLRALRSVDLSEARFLIPLPPGVDERPHLHVTGRVVWRTGQAAGFAFSPLPDETRATLERLTSLLGGPI